MPIAPLEIATPRADRIKSAALFASVAAACVAYLMLADSPQWWAWPVLVFFALFGLAEVYTVFRPIRLVLDRKGFVFTGGLAGWRKQRKACWADVDEFVVMTMPGMRGAAGRLVACKWKPGVKPEGVMKAVNRQIAGADAYIPMLWPRPPETMVAELNDYRRRAFAEFV